MTRGPYLDGADVAPPPLGYKVAGMAADYMAEQTYYTHAFYRTDLATNVTVTVR